MPGPRGVSLLLLLVIALCPAPAVAQTVASQPPGPFTLDLRGATIGVPAGGAFFPVLPPDTAVPARAFGVDVAAQVYPFSLGHARLGLGGSVTVARGSLSASGLSATIRAVAPQISFNFGHRDGWSYLSAGYGTVSIRSEAPVGSLAVEDGGSASDGGTEPSGTPTGGAVDSGQLRAVNVGGGARWFLSDHLAVGFDVRVHRVAAGSAGSPPTTLVGASVGVSLR